jgi:hypothetical protein
LIRSNAPNIPHAVPGRAELQRAERRTIKAGRSTKADLYRVDAAGGPLVIKDFAAKAAWVRWLGRLQIGRECKAYRWLGDQPGVARFRGRIDGHALALEWVDGDLLARATRHPDAPALYAKLARVVAGLHGRGLLHLDLRGRQNVMLGRDGEVYVLDLASAICLRPGGFAARCLAPCLGWADRAALLKWKTLLRAGPLDPGEASFLRRWRRLRALWLFNRKGQRTPEV